MKMNIACFVICCALVFGAWDKTALCDASQLGALSQQQMPSIKTLQNEALKNYQPASYTETFRNVLGMANAEEYLPTGEVWLLMMAGSPSGRAYAQSGFASGVLANIGTTNWTDVTITATFQVLSVQGKTELLVTDAQNRHGNWNTNDGDSGVMYVTTPGTYQVTSKPFTMIPGNSYKGYAWAMTSSALNPSKNVGYSSYVKITSIKFNFP